MSRARDQYHSDALAWHLLSGQIARGDCDHGSRVLGMAELSVSGRCKVAADGFEQIRRDPLIEVVRQSEDLSEAAIRLFSGRLDKDWSLTDCLSFVVIGAPEYSGCVDC